MDFSFLIEEPEHESLEGNKKKESVKITRAHKLAWFLPGGGPWARLSDEDVKWRELQRAHRSAAESKV